MESGPCVRDTQHGMVSQLQIIGPVPVLRARYGESGTDAGYAATRRAFEDDEKFKGKVTNNGELVRTPLLSYAPATPCPVRSRVCYAMFGTNLRAISRLLCRVRYCVWYSHSLSRFCYAMSGTDLGYHATRCAFAGTRDTCGLVSPHALAMQYPVLT
eukprot:3941943-Rhodomonas_salina.4